MKKQNRVLKDEKETFLMDNKIKEGLQEQLAEMYAVMLGFARHKNQTVGEKNDYYLTLEQIERFFVGEIYKITPQEGDNK